MIYVVTVTVSCQHLDDVWSQNKREQNVRAAANGYIYLLNISYGILN